MLISLKESYQVWWDLKGAQAAVARRGGDVGDDLFWRVFDYGLYDDQIGYNGKKFYVTFN